MTTHPCPTCGRPRLRPGRRAQYVRDYNAAYRRALAGSMLGPDATAAAARGFMAGRRRLEREATASASA